MKQNKTKWSCAAFSTQKWRQVLCVNLQKVAISNSKKFSAARRSHHVCKISCFLFISARLCVLTDFLRCYVFLSAFMIYDQIVHKILICTRKLSFCCVSFEDHLQNQTLKFQSILSSCKAKSYVQCLVVILTWWYGFLQVKFKYSLCFSHWQRI